MLRKLDRDSQILYDVTDVCNLKNNKLANIKKKKKKGSRLTEEQTSGSQWGGCTIGVEQGKAHSTGGKVSSRVCCTA